MINSVSHNDLANAVRFLSMDAVQRANSGHPGMPMGMADVATILFREFLKFDPKNPKWADRDRFVLSAGHGSMLLYSLLYLTGYKDVTLEDLKNFRQLKSKTAGHPEYSYLAGIETTTGPLGQGIANAVGMALAERMMNARFSDELVNHKTYCVVGDGCLMEGISQEAVDFAGHLQLSNLIVLWDNNSITIDGKTNITTSINMKQRFKASGWNVWEIDGRNPKEIREALKEANKSDKPSMIACKTTIGFGSPNKGGSEKTHGSPLGEDEIKLTRENLGWEHEAFEIPKAILNEWQKAGEKGQQAYKSWEDKLNKTSEDIKEEFIRLQNKELPKDWDVKLRVFEQDVFMQKPKEATRVSSGKVLEELTRVIPELIGGSADLTGSVKTKTSSTESVNTDDFAGRYINYGVREHGMAAIMNGMALHGEFIPYAGTFLVFSDYMRPAIRLSAIMRQRVIYVLTHDSIGLGEDGPTHQPVEHLASLRAIPNLNVFRPADIQETIECYEVALQTKHTPSVIVGSRQNLPFMQEVYDKENFSAKGAYIFADAPADLKPDVVLIATGSEVSLAMEAKKLLDKNNIATRVVSAPCLDIFDKQSEEYKKTVLGGCKTLKVGIEAACDYGWYKYIGCNGMFFGVVDRFGMSAPAEKIYEYLGLTPENVSEKVTVKIHERRDTAKSCKCGCK